MAKLTVALATYNEEKNLKACLSSIKDIADEIVIVDGTSVDNTVAVAKEFGAQVQVRQNEKIFHINKQKALDMATNEWILQLDADEIVSKKLAEEIKKIISFSEKEIEAHQDSLPNKSLFMRHQKLLEKRDGTIGTKEGDYSAFFIPRLNFFLGKNLRYGGVYPDGVIRLIKKNRAHFPSKDVHEQIVVNGRVGWLQNDLIHMADPTFGRYLQRNSRYIDLIAKQLEEENVKNSVYNSFKHLIFLPSRWFIVTFIRHKGFLDGWQGFVFSFFSALRFPRAYLRHIKK